MLSRSSRLASWVLPQPGLRSSNTSLATAWRQICRRLTTASKDASEEAKVPPSANPTFQQLYQRELRKELGPSASARKPGPRQGNYKYLAGIAVLFGAIYYYSVHKVGQDDFSDVDEFGNIREKVD